MKEIEQEIKRIEMLYDKLEKTKNGTSDDWYYSGMLKGLREALRLVKKINYIPCCTELLCVDKHIATYLTEGKKYRLLFEDEDDYYLRNNDDEVFGYNKIYFELVTTQ